MSAPPVPYRRPYHQKEAAPHTGGCLFRYFPRYSKASFPPGNGNYSGGFLIAYNRYHFLRATRCKQRAVHCLYNENKHPTHTSKQRAVRYSTTRTNIGKRVSSSPSPLHKLPHVPATLYLNTDRERTARCARGNPTKSLQRAVFLCQESPSRSASFPFRFGTLSATRARRSCDPRPQVV